MPLETTCGFTRDPWPYEYVVSALQFFALSPKEIDLYLPEVFSKTLFHGGLGDFYSTSPLSAVLRIYCDCVGVGKQWNDWIDDPKQEDRVIEVLFQRLEEHVEQAISFDDDSDRLYRDLLITHSSTPWVTTMMKCRELAIHILMKIDLFEEGAAPLYSAIDLLNGYSYGEYDDNATESRK